MAIFLIKDRDAINSDPEKDKMCYKKGDVVQVFEDGTPCVEKPAPPFLIIKVPGMSFKDAQKYIEEDKTIDGLDVVINRRRKYKIDFEKMAPTDSTTILKDRIIELSETITKPLLLDKTEVTKV